MYGSNAVQHIMTGKSVQRAFRGHLLIDRCVNHLIVSNILEDDPRFQSLIERAEDLYTSMLGNVKSRVDVEESDTLTKMNEKIDQKKEELSNRSKTSKLWINYQKMLQLARTLIRTDRTGSWDMHLSALMECLPVFSAAGHYNNLKSSNHYLQNMSQLQSSHPDVHAKFTAGFHVIRRSNQFWAGLSSDLVIEQTLMRSLKSSGGLTHGSGMTEEMRALWTMSKPVTARFNNAMQEFTDLVYSTSEQHKESTGSRMRRDRADMQKITEKFRAFQPFSEDPSLRNIVTGVVANDDVDVHEYTIIGNGIVEQLVGKPIFSVSFKRRDRAKTLAAQSSIKVAKDRTIDPALLFQRFLLISSAGDHSLELTDVMTYELSPFPAALFEAREILRKADKPPLAHAVEEKVGKKSDSAILRSIPSTEQIVIDGGSLLHRLPWKKGMSYGSIAGCYADFTVHHYGKSNCSFRRLQHFCVH